MSEEIANLVNSALAALSQNATFPANVEFAKKRLREAQSLLTKRAADLSTLAGFPLNWHFPDESGGAFFVHWSCSNCRPDDYDSSDSCHHCGKPRPTKSASR